MTTSMVPPALLPSLEVAVPLRVREMRCLCFERRAARAAEAASVIAEHGDDSLFRSKAKGATRRAFVALASAIALGAQQPGGITFVGRHWEAPPATREDRP
jgi:hypothetical protein